MNEVYPTYRAAIVSECGRYRYALSRPVEGGNGKRVLFVMLNPSTADADVDDPTIRKCVGFAKRWGYSGVLVGNLFAWRATDPVELIETVYDYDAVGPDNQRYLMDMMGAAHLVIPAWGANARELIVHRRARVVSASLMMLREAGVPVKDLGLTKGGHPSHPLFVAYNRALEDWPGYPDRAGLDGRVQLADAGGEGRE